MAIGITVTKGAKDDIVSKFLGAPAIPSEWENDFSELDPCGTSFVDKTYSKAYVRHLIHAQEMLGLQILSQHNLAFYLWLVNQAREHILQDDYVTWKKNILPQLSQRL